MQTPPGHSHFASPEFNPTTFALCWLLSGFLVAQAYFVLGTIFTDGFIWNYKYIYNSSESDDFCLMTIGDATMTTFPMVVLGMLMALPFALKLEKQVSMQSR